MKNLINLIEEIKTRPLRISITTRGEQIQQTDRNTLKKDLLQALKADLLEQYEFVYNTEDGIVFEIANDSVADKLQNEDGSGAITVALDLKIMGLEHNAEVESETYKELMEAKEAAKAEKQAKKKTKIAKDKADKEAKKAKEDE